MKQRIHVKDLNRFLWLLKLGALVNLYFLARTLSPPLASADAHIRLPALILFAVSAFRCLFPVSYKDNIVFHRSPLSSIFLTRLLATFSEIALIYQLAYLIRLLNAGYAGWVELLSWLMVLQVVLSQFFVWGAILTGNLSLYFYEELGWWAIYAANTLASAYLYAAIDSFGGRELLLLLNMGFGAVYLPWQFFHLRALRRDARRQARSTGAPSRVTWSALYSGLRQSIYVKRKTSESLAWGGMVGMVWMAGYWATLIPMWVFQMVRTV